MEGKPTKEKLMELTEKAVSGLISKGYEVGKVVLCDGELDIAFYMGNMYEAGCQELFKVTIGQLEDYKQHYQLEWSEVPEYYVQDMEFDRDFDEMLDRLEEFLQSS